MFLENAVDRLVWWLGWASKNRQKTSETPTSCRFVLSGLQSCLLTRGAPGDCNPIKVTGILKAAVPLQCISFFFRLSFTSHESFGANLGVRDGRSTGEEICAKFQVVWGTIYIYRWKYGSWEVCVGGVALLSAFGSVVDNGRWQPFAC